MNLTNNSFVIRVEHEPERQAALGVLQATYENEKHWVASAASMIPKADLDKDNISWFLAFIDCEPVGVVRVLYDPPIDQYLQYDLKDLRSDIDIEKFLAAHRIAEIGRFAVHPSFRSHMSAAALLMRAAATETVARGYTTYITDVFEGEVNSPYNFHRRVMGFETIATHDVGELACPNRRITMILDLAPAYLRMKEKGGWLFRFLTERWPDQLHERLSAQAGCKPQQDAPRSPLLPTPPLSMEGQQTYTPAP